MAMQPMQSHWDQCLQGPMTLDFGWAVPQLDNAFLKKFKLYPNLIPQAFTPQHTANTLHKSRF